MLLFRYTHNPHSNFLSNSAHSFPLPVIWIFSSLLFQSLTFLLLLLTVPFRCLAASLNSAPVSSHLPGAAVANRAEAGRETPDTSQLHLLLLFPSEGTPRAKGEACVPLNAAAMIQYTAARGAAAREAIYPPLVSSPLADMVYPPILQF